MKLGLLLFISVLAIAGVGTSAAQTAAVAHPEYTNARADLRSAQILMRVKEDPDVTNKLKVADVEINRAVWEMDHAGILDKSQINEHPPISVNIDRVGRFHKIKDLLVNARTILDHPETDPKAKPWRAESLKRINTALGLVEKAAAELKITM